MEVMSDQGETEIGTAVELAGDLQGESGCTTVSQSGLHN